MNDATPPSIPPHQGEGSLGHDRLARLMARGTDFLGCDFSVLGGAMSWI
jgi:hypothetical protein